MTAPDPTTDDVTAGLVDALYSAQWPDGQCVDSIGPGSMPFLTAAILGSDWLAERDARVAAEALRSVAEDYEIEGDDHVASGLREWADVWERGAS